MTTRRAVDVRSARRGITLTEILIAIMILGIGLVSLATLFPIGLLRIREAQRYSRTAFLAQSAGDDLASRGLLSKSRFLDPNFSPWYSELFYPTFYPNGGYDPWIQDTPDFFVDWSGGKTPANAGAYRGTGGRGAKYPNQLTLNSLPAIPGPGLPVAYDPLWWHQMGTVPDPTNTFEGRFGDGSSLGVPDGSGGGSVASMWGLQRLTNLRPTYLSDPLTNTYSPSEYNANMILSTFISPEDVLWQETDGKYPDFNDPTAVIDLTLPVQNPVLAPSPVVPDLFTSMQAGGVEGLTNDWRYTCMFVGQQSDSYNGRIFDGDVVVFENRPFGIDTNLNQVSGERVVQAVFGFGTTLGVTLGRTTNDNKNVAEPMGSNNAILLLWPAGTPDLEIKTGSWVADVTYERQQQLALNRFQYNPTGGGTPPPAQRCFWYQVQRVTPPADTTGTPYATLLANGRYSLVYSSTPLRAKTLWDVDAKLPYHVNAALVSPYVVGVAPRTIVMP